MLLLLLSNRCPLQTWTVLHGKKGEKNESSANKDSSDLEHQRTRPFMYYPQRSVAPAWGQVQGSMRPYERFEAGWGQAGVEAECT